MKRARREKVRKEQERRHREGGEEKAGGAPVGEVDRGHSGVNADGVGDSSAAAGALALNEADSHSAPNRGVDDGLVKL